MSAMKINEIFYSIQGEGYHTGTPAVFVRFSGCNLRCPFCDTDFNNYKEMTEEEIVAEVCKYPATLCVITGGEPSLQLTETLVHKLQAHGKYVAVETNGTGELPDDVDWVTCSPKTAFVKNGELKYKFADEVKVVFDFKTLYADPTFGVEADFYYCQPCDTGDKERNKEIMKQCVEFVKNNPKWRLSLQTQKILEVR